MYDPNNPITPPDGGFAITSIPGGNPAGIPTVPSGGRPSPPSPGMMPPVPSGSITPGGMPGGMPSFPGGMPGGSGSITPGGMPLVPGLPGGTPPMGGVPPMGGRPGGMPGGEGGGGGYAPRREAMRAYIDQFKNSLFQWLASRPEAGGDMQAWIAQRPQFDVNAFRQTMLNPAPAPAPAPAAITAPTGTAPVDPTQPPPIF